MKWNLLVVLLLISVSPLLVNSDENSDRFTSKTSFNSDILDTAVSLDIEVDDYTSHEPIAIYENDDPTKSLRLSPDLRSDLELVFYFKSYIDGLDQIRLQGNKLWIDHKEYQLPGRLFYPDENFPTYVNGFEWYPNWPYEDPREQTCDALIGKTLIPEMNWEYSLSPIAVRDEGSVSILENPSQLNNFTLIIEIDDINEGAAFWYEFNITRSYQVVFSDQFEYDNTLEEQGYEVFNPGDTNMIAERRTNAAFNGTYGLYTKSTPNGTCVVRKLLELPYQTNMIFSLNVYNYNVSADLRIEFESDSDIMQLEYGNNQTSGWKFISERGKMVYVTGILFPKGSWYHLERNLTEDIETALNHPHSPFASFIPTEIDHFTIVKKGNGSITYENNFDEIQVFQPILDLPPATPTGLAAIGISYDQIELVWDENTESDLAGYKFYRDGYFVSLVPFNYQTDTNLNPSTTYTYSVSAYDTSGNESPQSAPVSITTESYTSTTPYQGPTVIDDGSNISFEDVFAGIIIIGVIFGTIYWFNQQGKISTPRKELIPEEVSSEPPSDQKSKAIPEFCGTCGEKADHVGLFCGTCGSKL
ncbi:MAG: fibronectin type III domain-containing protein [Candidatus Kariarchaeaceae archaeon]